MAQGLLWLSNTPPGSIAKNSYQLFSERSALGIQRRSISRIPLDNKKWMRKEMNKKHLLNLEFK